MTLALDQLHLDPATQCRRVTVWNQSHGAVGIQDSERTRNQIKIAPRKTILYFGCIASTHGSGLATTFALWNRRHTGCGIYIRLELAGGRSGGTPWAPCVAPDIAQGFKLPGPKHLPVILDASQSDDRHFASRGYLSFSSTIQLLFAEPTTSLAIHLSKSAGACQAPTRAASTKHQIHKTYSFSHNYS